MDPITRTETYLASVAGQEVELPTPISREDQYLYRIATGEGEIPESPITREEAYLDAIVKGGGGGSSVTVEALDVTENGTYTAPSGKAYSPVNVQVSAKIETAPPKDVNFIDYDGTIVYSYTAEEFLALTEMPPNPDHTADGLTAEGWNWSLAGAKEYVTDYKLLWIGQVYITTDGKTHIHIELFKGRTSPYCGFGLNGTAVIEWGDGQTDTVTGTNVATLINTKHDYAEPGDYVIKIDVTEGTARILPTGSMFALVNNNSTTIIDNAVYTRAVKYIHIGSNVDRIDNYALNYCHGLIAVTVPASILWDKIVAPSGCSSLLGFVLNKITGTAAPSVDIRMSTTIRAISISEGSFTQYNVALANALANVTIPAGTTTLSGSFSDCYSITELYIPKSVTTIQANTFKNCHGLAELHFTPTTPPTVANSNAFSNIAPDIKIFVPSGSLAAYTSATNYPDPTVYTYIEE